ncbi:MAG: beta-ketoacyl synthase N-terminal-like domain-containing protein [Desulfobacterales bacterium]|nr:beta-ketoacyl synthase N-terminal-like domain-containing protein [Desulfobacterales bacterium]
MPNFESDLVSSPLTKAAGAIVPVITEAVTITGLGDGLGLLWRKLMNCESAIRPVNRFRTNNYTAGMAACIEDLRACSGQSLMHSLMDRLASSLGSVAPDTFLITATTKAGIDALEKNQKNFPADIREVLLSSPVTAVAQKLNLTHGGFNISAACASSTIAVARAAAMVASGRADAVLVCCADILTEFVFSGFSALKALSPVPCRPFDRNRNGLSLGEGAAALVIMSPNAALKKNRKPLGKVIGWGVANDATHITAPAQTGYGLVQSIARALRMSGKQADDISAVCAHGTGTIFNDLMEMTAFRQVFGKRPVPAYSIKGAIGHTLAAAGGIEVAVGLQSLKAQVLPPTVGLDAPMDEAVGRVQKEPTAFAGRYLLTTNSGFGGVNAALILEK